MSRKAVRTRGRPRKGSELEADNLLDAALDAFAEHGFEKANLRSIAAAAKVDVALISYHYGSKLELWKAVIESFSGEAMALLASVRSDGAEVSSRERLELTIEQLINVGQRKPQFARFVINEVAGIDQSERFEFFHNALTKPLRETLVPLIAAVNRSGNSRKVDPNLRFFAALGAMSMSMANRQFIARFAPVAKDDKQFRKELIAVISAVMCPENA
ncbi:MULTISPECIES: TetR/AcrR family transcriptional regulator [Bradyrhizobium]|nr:MULTISPECIES: TetR/AcrR family transcriptional regulator [Bradyrhizobium]MCG2628232.1 TetR family transcriptional regulator [Bradyrhizobium zhengyangense]MCG2643351.1 TetR family transcriptional regulator [Bradyrhizobium zhengyangense]MCG2670335.1 TetR family transcriptional regulator [Bradyrhizobium zhengyangense]MDN4985930.1 TetR/AcrR family transcriptional regulator [Bradyrhizobium sp. WYCCWR 13022]MDN5002690.1 TetR/AcrR family transcriptional regulator [Bradyrhizobium sp. WYCCWR 12677]